MEEDRIQAINIDDINKGEIAWVGRILKNAKIKKE